MNDEFGRISKVRPLMQSLYRFAKENLSFRPDASIAILKDNINADNPLGKTAYYDPANHKISLYTQGRHVKDVMRSLSHELVHHAQNCRGDFDGGIATVDGYAQEDGHLREMEREAYETGNLIFRDWEDGLKAQTNNSGLFNSRPLGEKLMENKINKTEEQKTMGNPETELREIIRGLVKEMLINIKEDGKGSFFDPERQEAEAARQAAEEEQPYTAGVEIGDEDEEKEEQNENVGHDRDCKSAFGEHSTNASANRLEECLSDPDYLKETQDESSFFPVSHNIREVARRRTNDALMKRWGYNKK